MFYTNSHPLPLDTTFEVYIQEYKRNFATAKFPLNGDVWSGLRQDHSNIVGLIEHEMSTCFRDIGRKLIAYIERRMMWWNEIRGRGSVTDDHTQIYGVDFSTLKAKYLDILYADFELYMFQILYPMFNNELFVRPYVNALTKYQQIKLQDGYTWREIIGAVLDSEEPPKLQASARQFKVAEDTKAAAEKRVTEAKESVASAEKAASVEFTPTPGNMTPGGPADFLRARRLSTTRASLAEAKATLDTAIAAVETRGEHDSRLYQIVNDVNNIMFQYGVNKSHEIIPDLDPFQHTFKFLRGRDLAIPEADWSSDDDTTGGPIVAHPEIISVIQHEQDVMKYMHPDEKDTVVVPLPPVVYNLILGIQTAYLSRRAFLRRGGNLSLSSPHLLLS